MSDETLNSEATTPKVTSETTEKVVDANSPFAHEPKPIPAPPETKPGKDAKDKARDEASQSPFSVTVGQVYDGPFDLLLDLIRKQNIDIYDIPIARITSQFLEYTHHLKQVDVDAAGEFIYMASLLIHIKSKTLLPRDPSDVTGADSEDPRRELVERLLEHERFKAAAQMLMQKQQIEEATWTIPGLRYFRRDAGELTGRELDEAQEIDADTVDLVRVFQEILIRLRERPILNVDEDSVTVAQMIEYVKRRLLMEDKPPSASASCSTTPTPHAPSSACSSPCWSWFASRPCCFTRLLSRVTSSSRRPTPSTPSSQTRNRPATTGAKATPAKKRGSGIPEPLLLCFSFYRIRFLKTAASESTPVPSSTSVPGSGTGDGPLGSPGSVPSNSTLWTSPLESICAAIKLPSICPVFVRIANGASTEALNP